MNEDGATNGLRNTATRSEVATKGTILVLSRGIPQGDGLSKLLGNAGYQIAFTTDVRMGLELPLPEMTAAVFVNSWPYWQIERICEICSAFALVAPNLPLTVVGPDDVEAKVRLFGLGADDYMVEPFDCVEFLARINSITRNQRSRCCASPKLWSTLKSIT